MQEQFPKTKKLLNQVVADLAELSALIHQVHWYMRGNGFLALHEKMDEMRGEVEKQLDEVAERLIALGGAPYSTLLEFDEHSKIEMDHADYDLPVSERLEKLVEAFRYMVNLYQGGIYTSVNEEEEVTASLLTDGLSYFQKQVWLISAEIGLPPH
ncbi:MAG: DNA starvation/stationary phase protection protein [Streptococcaceae bacterium]|jgi:starvation-inducible DNA-binding protein|nr:DNA starvation/stationary phase protection protein [Streptococcaceae bacterium]